MRSDELFSERGTAVMDTLEEGHTRTTTRAPRRRAAVLRAEDVDDEPEMFAEECGRRGGVRLRFRAGLMPRSKWGRVFAVGGLVMMLGMAAFAFVEARRFLLHDERFVIESSESIEIQGNKHLNRAQLLSVFGGDVERNIFNVSLAERRAELERLPWVGHATVMRLLPNRMQVLIVERVPVAFVREGGRIGLVDASGVLLDMPADMDPQAVGSARYSFPVVTGISAGDPLSTRGARMKIFVGFMKEMDSSGEKISEKLSEVDISNPEDVKALIQDGRADVMVHFGDGDYLERYRKFEQHLPEWRTQYPKLASVDMRYDRQVVLEMQPGVQAVTGDSAIAPDAAVAEVPAPTDGMQPAAQPELKKPVAAAGAAASAQTKAMLARGKVLKEQQKTAAGGPGASVKSTATADKLKTAAGKPLTTAEPSQQYHPQTGRQ